MDTIQDCVNQWFSHLALSIQGCAHRLASLQLLVNCCLLCLHHLDLIHQLQRQKTINLKL